MKKWKYVIVIFFGIIINYLFIQWNKTEVKRIKKIETQNQQISRDSLFSLVDKAVEDSKKEKTDKEKEINQLKVKVQEQTRQVVISNKKINELAMKEKTIEKENSSEVLMASGVDYSGLERELERRQKIMNELMRINSRLNFEVDSLKKIIENK